ncbi:unnamed protein product [Amoebophrya sp. A25]|nr:unnamed protein product [Amoebophrya sp. A25]|eukprot:GSA25T00004663001.1
MVDQYVEQKHELLTWNCSECRCDNNCIVECYCGAWLCIDCGNLNFKHRDSCNVKACGRPKCTGIPHSLDFITKYNEKQALRAQRGKGNSAMKGAGREREARRGLVPGGGLNCTGENDWNCPACQNRNYARRELCNRTWCGYARDPWRCPDCHNENFAGRFYCNRARCKRPHPAATAKHVAEHGQAPGHAPGGGTTVHTPQVAQEGAANAHLRPHGVAPSIPVPAGQKPKSAQNFKMTNVAAGTGGAPLMATMQPLLAADGKPIMINGQQVFVAAPLPAPAA